MLPDPTLLRLAGVVAEELDADVYFYSGSMGLAGYDGIVREFADAQERTNCLLILTTNGGDPSAAFVLAKFLKRVYGELTVMVLGRCKSAGTLLALGADHIVMSLYGELGPLDIQTQKDDAIGRMSSGLDIFQALTVVTSQAYGVFESNFIKLLSRTGGGLTTKTAAEIATSLTTQLFAPIAAQIDPIRLGEMQRALQIAREYGVRLGAAPETVDKLMTSYPAHGFVIDYDEAVELFPSVRPPTDDEVLLEMRLTERALHLHGTDCVRYPYPQGIYACLTPKPDGQTEIFDDGSDTAAAGELEHGREDRDDAPVRERAPRGGEDSPAADAGSKHAGEGGGNAPLHEQEPSRRVDHGEPPLKAVVS